MRRQADGGRRHRLLQQDRAPGPHRLDRQRLVRVVGRGDDDRRDVGPADRGGDVVGRLRHAVARRHLAGLFRRAAGDHADIRLGDGREAAEVIVRDEARAEQGDAEAVQGAQILALPGTFTRPGSTAATGSV